MVQLASNDDLKSRGCISIRLLEEKDLVYLAAWNKGGDYTKDWYVNYAQKNDDYMFIIMANGTPIGTCGFQYVDFVKSAATFGRVYYNPGQENIEASMRIGCQLVRQVGHLVFGIRE